MAIAEITVELGQDQDQDQDQDQLSSAPIDIEYDNSRDHSDIAIQTYPHILTLHGLNRLSYQSNPLYL